MAFDQLGPPRLRNNTNDGAGVVTEDRDSAGSDVVAAHPEITKASSKIVFPKAMWRFITVISKVVQVMLQKYCTQQNTEQKNAFPTETLNKRVECGFVG